MTETLLLGPLSVDCYLDEQRVLPGGGALNMAYHWAQQRVPFRLLSRVGDDHTELFQSFLERHGIQALPSLVAPGVSASIDIVMRADRQPWMDNFVDGVWSGFHLTPEEESTVRSAGRMHCVMVDAVADEVERLGAAGVLDGVEVTGDFLSFRPTRWSDSPGPCSG